VLGAWKFQQGKFCNFGKSGLGFLGDFCFCFQPRKASVFPAKRGHTCEERESVKGHTCERVQVHTCEQQLYSHTCEYTHVYSHTCDSHTCDRSKYSRTCGGFCRSTRVSFWAGTTGPYRLTSAVRTTDVSRPYRWSVVADLQIGIFPDFAEVGLLIFGFWRTRLSSDFGEICDSWEG
jgi:hypothetical protein